MRTARFCPVCWKVWDRSHCVGPHNMKCPVHEGVLTVQVFEYDEPGFVVPVLDYEEDIEE